MSEKQYGMLVRTGRCVGCQTCVVGCHVLNECPEGVYLGHLETVGHEDNYLVDGTFPNVRVTFRPHLCNHCAKPACVENCPTGAMRKREEDGVVETDPEVCIGCGTCVKACPYGAPALDEERKVAVKCNLCRPRVERGEGALVRVQLSGRGASVRRRERSFERYREGHRRDEGRAPSARGRDRAFGVLLLAG